MSGFDYYYSTCRLCGKGVKFFKTEITRDASDHLSERHPSHWLALLAMSFDPGEP